MSVKSHTHRSHRLTSVVMAVVLTGLLTGCSGGLSSFDPTDMLDFLDTKKKLPGDRKPVFPEGVPGLEQGVPKDLYKGNAEQEQQRQAAEAAATATPEEPKGKRGKKGRAAASVTAPAASTAATEPGADENTEAPAPKPKKIVKRRPTAPPAEAPVAAQQPQPAPPPQTQAASPFPAPLPSGSFQR